MKPFEWEGQVFSNSSAAEPKIWLPGKGHLESFPSSAVRRGAKAEARGVRVQRPSREVQDSSKLSACCCWLSHLLALKMLLNIKIDSTSAFYQIKGTIPTDKSARCSLGLESRGQRAALCCGSYRVVLPKAVSFLLHPQHPGDFRSFSAAAPGPPLQRCGKWSPGTLRLLKPTPYTTQVLSQFPVLAAGSC